MPNVQSDTPSVLTPSVGYKPHRYPWAYDLWKRQQQAHWTADEVPLGEDCKDWAGKLNETEKFFLTQIFRLFTQSDCDVQENYMDVYAAIFKPTEIRMMLSAFSATESIHIDAYSLLIETVGMPESEYRAFLEYEEMRDKHQYLMNMKEEAISKGDVYHNLLNMGIFAAYGEGLQLFASFAMLMNFPRFNKMKGMGQIVTWSQRDEALHCEGVIRLFHTYARETGYDKNKELFEDLKNACIYIVQMEDKFIDKAFSLGAVQGLTPSEVKQYVRYVADIRLQQLGIEPIYNIVNNPLPWIVDLMHGYEHSNFFEIRATEYSKGASKGDWNVVWDSFDEHVRVNNVLEQMFTDKYN